MKRRSNLSPRQRLASAGLTKRQAACMALHSFDGLTQSQIAVRLQITERAVRYHLVAARRRLREAGLRPRRRLSQFQAKIYPKDPSELDNLAPDQLKALW